MKNWSKKLLSALCVAALILGLVPLGVPALAAEAEHTLWLVGDSTVCAFTDAYYYPRYGYGTQIGNYLDGTYKVENLAMSGRSSKSFLTEANYETLKTGIKAGDALIIGFGHNDEKTEEARYTNPNGDWQTEGSFAKSLYDNYVKLAQDAGAEAILCTPIVRRAKNATFSDSELHITKDSGAYKGGDYPAAIRKLGADKNTAVVDLTKITQELYEGLGSEKTLYLHAWTSMKEGSVDNTHLNIYGAKVVAYQLAKALQAGGTELGKHVDLSAGEPTQEKDLVPNPEYKEPDYDPNLPASLYWKDYTCYNLADDTQVLTFKGSVFGDIGGEVALEGEAPKNHLLETDDKGNAHIVVKGGKGKISSTADGVAMYYLQLPVGTQFEFSATATLNAVDESASNPQQGGFGLMARDDMYIDRKDGAIHSDYVVAGTLGGTGACNCFFRQNGTLGGKAKLTTETLEVGKSYDLSIRSNSDGFACTFGSEPTQTGGYDFALTSVDSAYFYIGMFAARNLDVTFSNVSLVITSQPDPDQPDDPDTPDQPVVPVDGMVAGGGLETLFAELKGVKDADITAVKYTGAMTGELTGDDLEYLVRDGKDGARIDIPGLKEGKYDLTVTVAGKDYVAKDIQVLAHDRSGFAHQTVADDNTCTPYTEGVGAYNDDGTLKDNAIVLYVTDENKDTDEVTLSHNGVTVTGIGNILNSKGQSDSNKRKLLQKVSEAGIPIVVRILGTVTNPAGTTTPWSKENGGSTDDGGHMCIMQYVGNITIEGIGPDATVDGWGFSFSADGTGRTAEKNNKRDGQGENIEVRNLTFRNVPEDCIGINGSQDDKDGFKDSAEHVWVHNNSFYGPSGLPDKSKDQDKSGGDGALDFRNGEYMTSSYNYFEGYHKTSLVGSGNDNLQYHITWHHNHWKNVESRAPLARQADMHIYNNYFEGQTSYCMSLRANTYIFSEANTFQSCNRPVIDEKSGGVCKSYGDVFTDCTGQNDATIVTDKSQTVESANKFANFDTAPGSYVVKGDYKLSSPEDALKSIETYGGVMKAAADMTTVPFSLVSGSEPAEPTLTVTPATLSLKVGQTGKLTADLTGSTETVTWTSDKPEVATVAADGTVTAVAAGEATITAKAGTLTATATVTVTAESGDEPDVPPTPEEITIKINTSRITVRKTEKLRYTLTPENAVYGTIYWISGDTDVLAVTADGQATGVKTGTADVAVYVLKSAADGLTQDNILASDARAIQVVSGGTVGSAGSTTGQTTTPAKTETTTNDSGSTVKTESKSNGDKVVTVTDKSGEVVAKVEIPAQTPDLGYKFEDVPDDHWAEPSIQAMAAMNVFQGVSTTGHVFDMNSAVTRGTMAQVLFNLSQGKAGMTNNFADSADAWYTDAIAWAAAAGVVNGVSDTAFAPNDSITREQLATMLYRYAKLLNLDVSAKGDLTAFVDGSAVDSWASEAMAWAVGAGLIQGKGNNDLDPSASATRAEAAVIIDRFLMMV